MYTRPHPAIILPTAFIKTSASRMALFN
jgi:hypothetical protein